MKKLFFWIGLVGMVVLSAVGYGQIQQTSLPYSIRHELPKSPIPQTRVSLPSVQALRMAAQESRIPSIGHVLPHAIHPNTAGVWTETPEGGRLWQCQVNAQNAQALSFYFEDFHLPKGGQLYLYNAEKSQILGAFTHLNNRPDGHFATGIINGEAITLEYYEPPFAYEKGSFRVSEVGYIDQKDGFNGAARAGDCNVNIGCEEGELWQGVKGTVVRILIKLRGQIGWCTGTVLNNAREDFAPLVLTAQHCALNDFTGNLTTAEEINDWVFYFNYETSICQGVYSTNGLNAQSMVGATVLSESDDEGGDSGSDFLLLRLNADIPNSYEPVFAGWNRSPNPTTLGVTIHHPEGDVKKISTFTEPLSSASFGEEVANTHWEVRWSETANGHGVTEGGSSGSPLFNTTGQVVGTLTGGSASCAEVGKSDLYGKFSFHWAGNGTADNRSLSTWLDPEGKGILELRSINYQGQLVTDRDDDAAVFWESLQLYPNPNGGAFSILLPTDGFHRLQGSLYNLQGREIWSGKLPLTNTGIWQFSNPSLPKGIYLFKLTGKHGQRTFKMKIE